MTDCDCNVLNGVRDGKRGPVSPVSDEARTLTLVTDNNNTPPTTPGTLSWEFLDPIYLAALVLFLLCVMVLVKGAGTRRQNSGFFCYTTTQPSQESAGPVTRALQGGGWGRSGDGLISKE